MASKEPTTIDFEEARIGHDRGRIETFNISVPLGGDPRHLVRLAGQGRLEVPVGRRGDWHSYEDAVAQLLNRQVRGKAVLDVQAA